MNTYTVRYNQNIFDVAVQIYGSTDGVSDLMNQNEDLSFNSDLNKGDVLNYDPSESIDATTVKFLYDNSINIGNGESSVYKKDLSEYTLLAMIYVPITSNSVSFKIAGSGDMAVDWGDNQEVDEITLQSTPALYKHTMDNNLPESRSYRKIKFFGNPTFSITSFEEAGVANISKIYFINNLSVEDFNLGVCSDMDYLGFLKMCDGITSLSGVFDNIDSLLPLDEIKTLENINIKGSVITSVALTEYLIEVVKNYDTRSICTVDLTGSTIIVGDYQSPVDVSDPQNGQEARWVLENIRGWTFIF